MISTGSSTTATDVDAGERFEVLLKDSDTLLEKCSAFDDVTEYQLFIRCLSEQTIVEDGKRRLRTKEDGTMDSDLMQSPVDPDATFRTKAGKRIAAMPRMSRNQSDRMDR